MKNSLGTLAAVAALAVAATTTTASADVQYATHLFGKIAFGPTIDINNDGITDYRVINDSLLGAYDPSTGAYNQIAVDGDNWLYNFSFNDTIDLGSVYNRYAYIDISMPIILGLDFYIDEKLHYAWLQ